jgi:hypothetical protein
VNSDIGNTIPIVAEPLGFAEYTRELLRTAKLVREDAEAVCAESARLIAEARLVAEEGRRASRGPAVFARSRGGAGSRPQ